MNPQLQQFMETKLNEIKETIKEYVRNLYGDIQINKILIEEDWDKDDETNNKKEIEITVWSDKGYFSIKS